MKLEKWQALDDQAVVISCAFLLKIYNKIIVAIAIAGKIKNKLFIVVKI
jgi:hypothetical protein